VHSPPSLSVTPNRRPLCLFTPAQSIQRHAKSYSLIISPIYRQAEASACNAFCFSFVPNLIVLINRSFLSCGNGVTFAVAFHTLRLSGSSTGRVLGPVPLAKGPTDQTAAEAAGTVTPVPSEDISFSVTNSHDSQFVGGGLISSSRRHGCGGVVCSSFVQVQQCDSQCSSVVILLSCVLLARLSVSLSRHRDAVHEERPSRFFLGALVFFSLGQINFVFASAAASAAGTLPSAFQFAPLQNLYSIHYGSIQSPTHIFVHPSIHPHSSKVSNMAEVGAKRHRTRMRKIFFAKGRCCCCCCEATRRAERKKQFEWGDMAM
jgi:hypothetical protein